MLFTDELKIWCLFLYLQIPKSVCHKAVDRLFYSYFRWSKTTSRNSSCLKFSLSVIVFPLCPDKPTEHVDPHSIFSLMKTIRTFMLPDTIVMFYYLISLLSITCNYLSEHPVQMRIC